MGAWISTEDLPGSVTSMYGGEQVTFDPRSPCPAEGTFQRTPIAKLNGSLLPLQALEMQNVADLRFSESNRLNLPPSCIDPRSPVPSSAKYERSPMQAARPPQLFDPRSPAPVDGTFDRTPLKTVSSLLNGAEGTNTAAWDPRSPSVANRTPLADVMEAKAAAKEVDEIDALNASLEAVDAKVKLSVEAADEKVKAAAEIAAAAISSEGEDYLQIVEAGAEEGPIQQPKFEDAFESVQDILGSLPTELTSTHAASDENDVFSILSSIPKRTASQIDMKASLVKRKTSKAALVNGTESSPRKALGGITNSPTSSPARQIKMAIRSASSPARTPTRKQSTLYSQLAPNATTPQAVELTAV